MRHAFRAHVIPLALAVAATLVFAAVPRADVPPRHMVIHAAHWVDVKAGVEKGPVWVVISGDTIESVRTSAPGGTLEAIELGNATTCAYGSR